LGVPFHNCPTQGKDVVVSIDAIIGGPEGAGKGWFMLMDCLAAGRGISLPAQAAGGAKLITRVTSAHSVIRQQFGVSIGKFEGVEEPLARIGAFTYLLEAMRKFTVGAIDKGIKPPVITAIAKYHSTEIGRRVVNDGMDVMGGAAISLGSRNLIGEIYIATPIGITVEGANIMTRTLIIFGQGALRAHPFAYKEVKAIEENDLAGFDAAFWGHIGHIVRNTCRSIVMTLTRGYVASAPVAPELKMYARRLSWASATFAILADLAMGTLGGSLKFREKVTGRFADILAWMYICSAVIRRYEAEGRNKEHLAFVKYSLKFGLAEIQKAFDGLFDNIYGVEQKTIGGKILFGSLHFVFKHIFGTWSRINSLGSQATDHLQHAVCNHLLAGGTVRDDLTRGMFMPKKEGEQLLRLERALKLVLQAEEIERKIYKARRSGQIPKVKGAALVQIALEKNVISAQEAQVVQQAADARWDAIQVDDFSQQEYLSR
jgi:acyl-CoA dehydrogenase